MRRTRRTSTSLSLFSNVVFNRADLLQSKIRTVNRRADPLDRFVRATPPTKGGRIAQCSSGSSVRLQSPKIPIDSVGCSVPNLPETEQGADSSCKISMVFQKLSDARLVARSRKAKNFPAMSSCLHGLARRTAATDFLRRPGPATAASEMRYWGQRHLPFPPFQSYRSAKAWSDSSLKDL